MVSEKQEFSFQGYTADQLLLYAYGTFLELEWTPKYAGPSAIVAHTPPTGNKQIDEIIIEAREQNITVTSIHNESFDIMKRNQMHINDFITALKKVMLSEPDPAWTKSIVALRKHTKVVVAEHQERAAESAEIEKVMKTDGSNLYATYLLIGINLLVFIIMAIDGAGVFTPDGFIHIKWGSNFTPLTLGGEWWRIITCMFLHFGILHLALNMYGLYMAGIYLEPMLGKIKYIVAYLATGVIASIVSLWWHKEGVNSAGASGAIFGMYGLFLGLLFTNLIPRKMRIALLQAIGIMVVFNIGLGIQLQGLVDNAAHIGGLVSGMMIGLFYYWFLKQNKRSLQWAAAAVVAFITFVAAFIYIDKAQDEISPAMVREKKLVKRALAHKDGKEFYMKRAEIGSIERIALAPLWDTSLNWQARATQLDEVSRPQWEKLQQMFKETENDDIAPEAHHEAALWIEYAEARLEEIKVISKIAAGVISEEDRDLDAVNEKINNIAARLNNLN